MQTYLLKLLASQPYLAYQAQGDLFVYESGVEAAAGDTRIIVKPDSRGEITLRPGQRFRLAPGERATSWAVRTFDPAATLTGAIIIGAGEFDDANTLNKFTLDATFANSVKVTNTTAERVPVTLDTNQLVKLDPASSLNTTAPFMAYTAFKTNVTAPLSSFTAMITAAENVNGVIIEQMTFQGSSGVASVLVKATTPGNGADGARLVAKMVPSAATPPQFNQRMKVAAGQAVWVYNQDVNQALAFDILYTAL